MKTLKQVLGLDEDSQIKKFVRNETGYRVTIIERFSADGNDVLPDGHYQRVKYLLDEQTNRSAFVPITERGDDVVYMAEGFSFDLAKPWTKGGMIVFSVDVNAVNDPSQAKTKLEKWKRVIQNKWDSLINKTLTSKKLTALVTAHNKVVAGEKTSDPNEQNPHKIVAFSMGQFFKGRYLADNGNVFDETSTSMEVIGIPSAALLLLATAIAREFKQETVLVKDYSTGRIYLADRSEVSSVSQARDQLKTH